MTRLNINYETLTCDNDTNLTRGNDTNLTCGNDTNLTCDIDIGLTRGTVTCHNADYKVTCASYCSHSANYLNI